MKWLVKIADGLNQLRDFPPLLFRLILAYGFLGPALNKWSNPGAFAGFLASMDYPVPEVSAWIAIIVESLGVILLVLGLATRLWAIPLMALLVVAIGTVHLQHGFHAANGGFEIPLYYFLMLFSLFITGPGRISVDAILTGKIRQQD